jgi:hypothetical protein
VLKERHRQYYRHHASWNHNTAMVDVGIKAGVILGAEKPPGFACPACEASDPIGARFTRNTKTGSSVPGDGIPYHHIEIDLWGSLDVDDRRGNRFMFGAIDRATGKIFFQPLRAKSEALAAMQRLFVVIAAQSPGIEMHLKVTTGRDVSVTGVHIVSSDRGGEFTTTFGGTRSGFDELLQSLLHLLNTPDTAKSGTTRIERAWRTITFGMRWCWPQTCTATSRRTAIPSAWVKVPMPRSGCRTTCGTSFSSGLQGTLGWVGRRAATRRSWSFSSA